MLFFFCFFFQAEDGIRYLTVTGVQTCALPIWDRRVFVTGCTGLVGSWTVRALLERGAHVVGLVRDGVPGSELVRAGLIGQRSEERRVGKECRARWSAYH